MCELYLRSLSDQAIDFDGFPGLNFTIYREFFDCASLAFGIVKCDKLFEDKLLK